MSYFNRRHFIHSDKILNLFGHSIQTNNGKWPDRHQILSKPSNFSIKIYLSWLHAVGKQLELFFMWYVLLAVLLLSLLLLLLSETI